MNSKTYLKNSTKPLFPFTAASFCVAWNRSPLFRSPFSVKYHPDHLGSSSWITDSGGHAIQHLQYLPFGETRVDQRTTSWNTRYSFSAKEKDEESGYGYFGARYYNSDLSIWLSVDPMAGKYPNLSPYAYVANNPIKLVDPNGMEIEDGLDGHPKKGCVFFDPHPSASSPAKKTVQSNQSNTPTPSSSPSSSTSTTTTKEQEIPLVPNNPIFSLSTSSSETTGEANVLNKDNKVTVNPTSIGSTSTEYQLGIDGLRVGANSGVSSTIVTAGVSVEVGYLTAGISLEGSPNFLDCSISFSIGVTANNKSNSITIGIKPLGAAAAAISTFLLKNPSLAPLLAP